MIRFPVWIPAILASVWIGCASAPAPERHWEKPGAGAGELDRDREACVAGAMEADGDAPSRYEHQVRGSIFFQCMNNRGWMVVEE